LFDSILSEFLIYLIKNYLNIFGVHLILALT